MIRLDVRADIRQAQRYYSNLRRNAVPKAGARAINDVLITVRAEGAREIKRQHTAMRIGDIKDAMKIDRAFWNKLYGSVSTTGTPLSLLSFSVAGGEVSRRKIGPRGQVAFSLKRRFRPITAVIGTKRAVMQLHGRKAFRVPGTNEIFVRRNAKGRQFRRLRGPSLPGVFRAQYGRFEALAKKRWPAAFRSRMAYEIELAKRG